MLLLKETGQQRKGPAKKWVQKEMGPRRNWSAKKRVRKEMGPQRNASAKTRVSNSHPAHPERLAERSEACAN